MMRTCSNVSECIPESLKTKPVPCLGTALVLRTSHTGLFVLHKHAKTNSTRGRVTASRFEYSLKTAL